MVAAYDKLPAMSQAVARMLLSKHSFTHDDVDDPAMENGFLGSLRPYKGKLNHSAFHEVVACLKALGPSMSNDSTVDRQVVSNLWGICKLSQDWAVDPDGMLRRNNLISTPDIETMKKWIDCISYATMMLLEDPDPSVAFVMYEDYMDGSQNAG